MSLRLARGVAESHGGELIISEPADHTPIFTISLPLDARSAVEQDLLP